ncbi:MAG TPA: sulfatase-like hydrolase/transferase [Bacteroidales bacterium]|nr:sulfatase-like hydrolase/transferase [Bacteroidales bacterium]
MATFNSIKMLILNRTLNLFTNILRFIKPTLKEIGIYASIIFVELFVIRIFEFTYLKYHLGFGISYLLFEIKGIYYDFIFISISSALIFIPFLFLHRYFPKIIKPLFYTFNVIVVLIYLILLDYLRFTFTPLDHAFFVYPFNEIIYITKTSVTIGFFDILRYILLTALCIFVAFIFLKYSKRFKLLLVGIIFVFTGTFLAKNINPARKHYSNELSFNLTINKLSYFIKSSANYFLGKSEITKKDFSALVNNYQHINNGFNYINPNYPLERTPDTTDVLGSYFNLNSEPPNIVFVIMESLSSAFCGSNAYLGNFMPFLDSLINHSLYWENYLSTSERTFNAIPSIFGSLPYGERGFMELIHPEFAVNHTTFIQFLNKNGYYSSFYYGGWIGFDNMGNFFEYQNTNFILKNFGEKYSKIEKDKNGFSWGYPDKSLFMRSFEVIDSINKNPRFDIYLTISLHHPFNPPNREYYFKKFENRVSEIDIDKKIKDEIINYTDIFATVLYTDDAIKYLIETYKNRKEFNNTIFIITGDHRLGLQNSRNNLDKYHVPFIIYSPMLKKAVKFSSVSSHANVAPTLYTFMASNFGFKLPGKVHWLGSQIDTSQTFRNRNILPLMKTNREISEFLSNNYFVSGNDLYELSDGLNLKLVENPNLRDSLQRNLNYFKLINQYITQHNLLLSED